MKAEINDLLTDIKAAIQIGQVESLWAALEGLLEFPEIAGNPVMEDAFIKKVILPVGKALANPKVKPEHLQTLAEEPQAALQAVAAAAWAHQLMAGSDVKAELEKLGASGRKDVRAAVGLGLVRAGENTPEVVYGLAEKWIKNANPALQETALKMFPLLARQKTALDLLAQLPPPQDPDVRAGLAEAVSEAAQGAQVGNAGNAEQVLELLESWTESPETYAWVICKALARGWAAGHADETLAILAALVRQGGADKQIKNVLQALARNGAGDAVEKTMGDWRGSGDEKLVDFANRYQS